jgi:hypothetical protein
MMAITIEDSRISKRRIGAKEFESDTLRPAYLLIGHDIQLLLIAADCQSNPIDVNADLFTAQDFHASGGLVHSFQKQNGFISPRLRRKRRPGPDLAQVPAWHIQISQIIQ